MKSTLIQSAFRGIALTAIAFTLGCVSVGKEFNAAPVTELKNGETTRSEVRVMFGNPWREGIEDGYPTWTYGYYRYSLFGKTKTRDLVLRFNELGILESYSYNTSNPEDN